MKDKEEKLYYKYLENVLKQKSESAFFWKRSGEDWEIDIDMIINHIQKKNPNLASRLFGNLIDVSKLDNLSKANVLQLIAKTEKGTIVHWRNNNDEDYYLLNNGTNLLKSSKRIVVLGKNINAKDLEFLKKSKLAAVLKSDIKNIQKKMEKNERKKRINNTFKMTKLKLGKVIRKIFQKKEITAQGFERDFKLLVKNAGSGISAENIAFQMVNEMNGPQKKELQTLFKAKGIKNEKDLNGLLNRWKEEALNQKPRLVITQRYDRTR